MRLQSQLIHHRSFRSPLRSFLRSLLLTSKNIFLPPPCYFITIASLKAYPKIRSIDTILTHGIVYFDLFPIVQIPSPAYLTFLYQRKEEESENLYCFEKYYGNE
jgi:hypothetical protein